MNEVTRDEAPDSGSPAFELDGITKRFGETVAAAGVSFAVPRGSLYGVVGPNGAGKTTSLNMATGLLRPDGGSARIFGVDMWTDPEEAKALVGVLPDGLAMSEQLTGQELLTYLGMLRGIPASAVRTRSEELLRVLELEIAEHTLIGNYSTGMRKKLGLATALLHAPRLLVLDEPFEGVDPISALTIRGILQRFVASGGSVVFSSHVMQLVEQLCDHVAVIADGRVVAAGSMQEVRGESGTLEDRFIDLVGIKVGTKNDEAELPWLMP